MSRKLFLLGQDHLVRKRLVLIVERRKAFFEEWSQNVLNQNALAYICHVRLGTRPSFCDLSCNKSPSPQLGATLSHGRSLSAGGVCDIRQAKGFGVLLTMRMTEHAVAET